ncbi:hypothetical protein KY290_016737 [Solanum tuberosum]|uniref:Uncharacterized protein n=1 Tax=Solanum tuberosum TaxID=4113 RepID=A0ABQ7V9C7_SOLTU|nr:hypothetical protein KY284_016020 [Solanum tuberosum]KAH0701733.1 hypothetical protein KY285_016011 [Solanum tuberosum]KAH0760664.1 hypothetical protein KY290_016737 [Solanum tuberosum]
MGNPPIRHEPRGKNKVVDLLAKEGQKIKSDKLFEEWRVPPLFVWKILEAERVKSHVLQAYKPQCNLN